VQGAAQGLVVGIHRADASISSAACASDSARGRHSHLLVVDGAILVLVKMLAQQLALAV